MTIALIDRDEWVKYFESELGIWAHPESLDWAIGKLKNAAAIDPIHYAGGCYCRECEQAIPCETDHPYHLVREYLYCNDRSDKVEPDGWCKWGRRKEDADG